MWNRPQAESSTERILHNKSNLEIPRSLVFREVQVTERANASIQQIIALLKNDSYTASCILGRLNNAQPVRAYSHRHVDSKLGDYLQWLIYTLTYKIFGLTIRSWEGTLVPGPTHINYNNNNLRIVLKLCKQTYEKYCSLHKKCNHATTINNITQ